MAGVYLNAKELKKELEALYPDNVEVLLSFDDVEQLLKKESEPAKPGLTVITSIKFDPFSKKSKKEVDDLKELCKTFKDCGFHVAVYLNFSTSDLSCTLLDKVLSHKVKEAEKCGSASSKKSKENRADVYQFSNPKLGLAVLMNNSFRGDGNIEREGALMDVKAAGKTFVNYGFDVLVCLNFHSDAMISVLNKVAQNEEYHRIADCFVCAIMTHGDEQFEVEDKNGETKCTGIVLSGDCLLIDTQILFDLFSDTKCPGLKEKPKLFFIQACRGGGRDFGLKTKDSDKKDSDPDVNLKAIDIVPTHLAFHGNVLSNDTVIMYASSPGYRSKRDPGTGTWFVNSLCKILDMDKCPTVPLLHALTSVQAKVATEFVHTDIINGDNIQMPVVDFRLTKDLYLPRKEIVVG